MPHINALQAAKEFTSELDTHTTSIWKTVQTSLREVHSCITTLNFIVKMPEEFYSKWQLTPALEFEMHSTGGSGNMSYYYRGCEVRPDCYFLRPKGYQKVSTLQILQECVKQDTHQPDIKPLELPKDSEIKMERIESC